ncbi:hypothetical protein CLV24_108154 [Pontibacter ummariensis]|uniref:Uncharacterized protein n=1 Tax=Pontibacter ummariensis TaxID=1610492 RepID=A0A239F8A4_9BACT|nr:hypothetical protein [Pontibacter ummariensis]PRY12410.1 hypothetical protein CLV24_108154 [Pontibacter ummariensis]SNS52314.1 hypothetical protein SAMN06296052_10831 [Pontibacter ummariensis]
MENPHLENWDEEKYTHLNTYFRIRIEQLLRQDPELQQLLEQNKAQLQDVVNSMNEDDQERWQEFVELDQQKLQIDMWNHLHGIGTPYNPRTGFRGPDADEDEEAPRPW